MKKFEKTFELYIAPWTSWGDKEKTIVIVPPIMMDFDVKKNNTPGANTGEFTIYNLGKNTRNRISELLLAPKNEGGTKSEMDGKLRAQLSIGYNGENTIVFDGEISSVYDSHERFNLKTKIKAEEGAYAMSKCASSHTFAPGTSMDAFIKKLGEDLKPFLSNAESSYIGKLSGQFNAGDKDLVVRGNTWALLEKHAKLCYFIDQGSLYVIPKNGWNKSEYMPSFEISARNGLIGAPVMEKTTVVARMLYEPQLRVGALALLKGDTLPGEYVISAIAHKRDLSRESDSITTVTLGKRGADGETQDASGDSAPKASQSGAEDSLRETAKNATNTDLTPVISLAINNALIDLNCHKLGKIVSFDSETQTATVDLNHEDDQELPYPELKKVPVFIPTGGNASLTMPVAKGDTCLLLFSDRNIKTWFETGAIDKPRFHDINEGLAIVGFRPKDKKIEHYNKHDAELRNGKAVLAACENGLVRIQSGTENLHGLLSELIQCLRDLKVDTNSGLRVTPTDTKLTEIESQLNALLGKP